MFRLRVPEFENLACFKWKNLKTVRSILVKSQTKSVENALQKYSSFWADGEDVEGRLPCKINFFSFILCNNVIPSSKTYFDSFKHL